PIGTIAAPPCSGVRAASAGGISQQKISEPIASASSRRRILRPNTGITETAVVGADIGKERFEIMNPRPELEDVLPLDPGQTVLILVPRGALPLRRPGARDAEKSRVARKTEGWKAGDRRVLRCFESNNSRLFIERRTLPLEIRLRAVLSEQIT